MPQYFNSTAAFPMNTKKRVYATGGRVGLRHGGRARKQVGGPMSTARRDMTHGYYQPDMGMQGGRMFRGGGAVKKKGSIGVALKAGGRARKFGGGRTNLLEELGRVEAKPSNPNRRAEISRVHSELNRGYKTGGRIGLKKGGSDKNWIQDVNKSIKKRGTKGKCTPITKKGCTGRAKALAKTFKKMARKRKG